jgi:hypothetical protein
LPKVFMTVSVCAPEVLDGINRVHLVGPQPPP